VILNLVSNMIQPVLRYSIRAPGADFVTLIKDLPLGQTLAATIVRQGNEHFLFIGESRVLKLPVPEGIPMPVHGQKAELTLLAKSPTPKFTVRLLSDGRETVGRQPAAAGPSRQGVRVVDEQLQTRLQEWFPAASWTREQVATLPPTIRALVPLLPETTAVQLMRSVPRLLEHLSQQAMLPESLTTLLRDWVTPHPSAARQDPVQGAARWRQFIVDYLSSGQERAGQLHRPLIPMPARADADASLSVRLQWAVQAMLWWLEQQGAATQPSRIASATDSLWDNVLYQLLGGGKAASKTADPNTQHALILARELLKQTSSWLLQNDLKHQAHGVQKSDTGTVWLAEWPMPGDKHSVQIAVEDRNRQRHQTEHKKERWTIAMTFHFTGEEELHVSASLGKLSGTVEFSGNAACLEKLDDDERSRFANHMTDVLGVPVAASVRPGSRGSTGKPARPTGHWEV
jgi:hypothetical protein